MGGYNNGNTTFVFHDKQTFEFADTIQVVGGSFNGMSGLKPLDLKSSFAGKTADEIYNGKGLPTQAINTSRIPLQDILRSQGGSIEKIGTVASDEFGTSEDYYRLHLGSGEFLDFHGSDLRAANRDLANIAEDLKPGITVEIGANVGGQKHAAAAAPQGNQPAAGRIEGNSYTLGEQDIAAFNRVRVRAVSGDTTLRTIGGALPPSLSSIAVEGGQLKSFNSFSAYVGENQMLLNTNHLRERMADSPSVTITREADFKDKSFYRISFGDEYIVVESKYMPKGVLAKVQGLEAQKTFQDNGYKPMTQLKGPSAVAEAKTHPFTPSPSAPVQGFGSTRGEYQGPDNGLLPNLEGMGDLGQKLGDLSRQAGADVRERMAGPAAEINEQARRAVQQGGTPQDMLPRLFGVGGGLVGMAKGGAMDARVGLNGLKQAMEGMLAGAKPVLQQKAQQLEPLGDKIRDQGRKIGEDLKGNEPAKPRYLKPDEMPWLKEKQPEAPPPLPQGRPHRTPAPDPGEKHGSAAPVTAPKAAPVTPVAAPRSLEPPTGASVQRVSLTSPVAPGAEAPRVSEGGRPAITWNGGRAKGFNDDFQKLQTELAKDPECKKLMTFKSSVTGKEECADGREGHRSVDAIKHYIAKHNLPADISLKELTKHAHDHAPVFALDTSKPLMIQGSGFQAAAAMGPQTQVVMINPDNGKAGPMMTMAELQRQQQQEQQPDHQMAPSPNQQQIGMPVSSMMA